MRIQLRIDDLNDQHAHITFFIDAKNCEQLCLGREDWNSFYQTFMHAFNLKDQCSAIAGKALLDKWR